MRDDRHFLREAVDMLGLLFEIGKRDEERKVAILVPRRLDPVIEQPLYTFPDAVTPRPDDHAPAHAAFLGQIGLGNDGLIPGREIGLARDGECVLDRGHGGAG